MILLIRNAIELVDNKNILTDSCSKEGLKSSLESSVDLVERKYIAPNNVS